MLNNKNKIESEIIEVISPLLENMGYELIDLTYKRERGWILRIYIDKNAGITLEDCENVSNFVGDLLDARNLIPESYNLEVSSPGINRPLTKKEHFQRFSGNKCLLQLKEPYLNRKNFKGIIKGVFDDFVEIVNNEDNQNTYNIPFNLILKARLDII